MGTRFAVHLKRPTPNLSQRRKAAHEDDMWSFWTGQKVVCVDDCTLLFKNGEIKPIKDHIYEIRTIHFSTLKNELALRLVEIVNKPRQYTNRPPGQLDECAFLARHFRPVKDTKSDISLLTSILRMADVTRELENEPL